MQVIADAAGVHPQTVYLAFGTKAAVLAEAATLLAGADSMAPPPQPCDPVRRLYLYARQHRDVAARLGPLLALVVAEAYRDPDVAAFCDDHQANDVRAAHRLVAELEASGSLRPGIGSDEAADVVYALCSPHSYLRLVGDRGWSPDRYEEWLGGLLCDRLLRPGLRSGRSRG
jgi:AcrR family transcriptional regulator